MQTSASRYKQFSLLISKFRRAVQHFVGSDGGWCFVEGVPRKGLYGGYMRGWAVKQPAQAAFNVPLKRGCVAASCCCCCSDPAATTIATTSTTTTTITTSTSGSETKAIKATATTPSQNILRSEAEEQREKSQTKWYKKKGGNTKQTAHCPPFYIIIIFVYFRLKGSEKSLKSIEKLSLHILNP